MNFCKQTKISFGHCDLEFGINIEICHATAERQKGSFITNYFKIDVYITDTVMPLKLNSFLIDFLVVVVVVCLFIFF